jgi:uncharacterized repeat protein (TIGR03803 family)
MSTRTLALFGFIGPRQFLAIFVFCAATVITSSGQTFTTLADLTQNNAYPLGQLVQGFDGNFYGVTEDNGISTEGGTIYVVTPAGAVTTLHNLSVAEGGIASNLGLKPDGTFFGIACCAVTGEWGTAFNVTPRGEFSVLYNFDQTTGSPDSALFAPDKDYYGTTLNGGSASSGSVFSLSSSGSFDTLYSFCTQTNCPDQGEPESLIRVEDNSLYGTAIGANPGDFGIIFRLTPDGVFTNLHTFCTLSGCPDGFWPFGLIQATHGDFYGFTEFGGLPYVLCWPQGPSGCGTIFKITPEGNLSTLHVFCKEGTYQCLDGGLPGGLLLATDGNFYGTTSGMATTCSTTDTSGCGTIFKMTPSGHLTTLHTFDNADGEQPGGLVQSTDGNFYGTTGGGGTNSYGTVFKLSMGLSPFVKLSRQSGVAGETDGILGQGLTGTTAVSVNGAAATFTVVSDTYIRATIPDGATTGYVTVATPTGTLTSNAVFQVRP